MTFEAIDGNGNLVRARLDMAVSKDGKISIIECKCGLTAKVRRNQQIVIDALREGKAVARGKSAEKAALK